MGTLIGTGINMILDPIMILGLDMGVTGAAIATVLGNIVGSIFYIRFLRTKGKMYSMSLRNVSFRKDIVLKVISLGLPLSCVTILMSVSSALANNLMIDYGAVAVAGQSIAGKIGMVISMVVMGICIGMQPAISYNFSANNRERLIEILKKTTVLAIVTGAILSIVCLIFRDRLLLAFFNNDEVLSIGRVCLLATIIEGPVFALYQMCASYLQATGKAVWAVIASVLNKGLLYIPILYLLSVTLDMYGIIFAMLVTTILSAVLTWAFSRIDFKKVLAK